jgi:hypothetical protein
MIACRVVMDRRVISSPMRCSTHFSRVMKFMPADTMGTVLFTTNAQSPSGLTLDNMGAVYVGTYGGIMKWRNSSSSAVTIIPAMYSSVNHIAFDSFGHMYAGGGYSMGSVIRYNLTNNIC